LTCFVVVVLLFLCVCKQKKKERESGTSGGSTGVSWRKTVQSVTTCHGELSRVESTSSHPSFSFLLCLFAVLRAGRLFFLFVCLFVLASVVLSPF
jgi:hypothetical protein